MENKKQLTGIIQIYSKKSRDQIFAIGMRFAASAGLEALMDDIYSCVDELIKNAVKANYKFLLILDKITEKLKAKHPEIGENDIRKEVLSLIKDRQAYDTLAAEIIAREDIADRVRTVLNEEGKYLSIKNRVYDEDRDYTDAEKKTISSLKNFIKMRKELRERNIKILLKIEIGDDFIYLEITNTAPILTQDLNRIYEKRDEYRTYRMEGREYEFFINNIDTSDSGFGLGYAKIDSYLANLGLVPENSITIISANNTTALLVLPLAALRKKVEMAQ